MEAEERALRQAFIRHLVTHVQCVGCGERYGRNDIYVLGHHEDVWVSAVICSHCGTQGLVFATLRSQEQFEVQSERQMDSEKISRHLPALTVDDVLDLHAFLKDYAGDMTSLFGGENAES